MLDRVKEKLVELLNAIDGVCPKDASCYDCEYKDRVHCAIPAKADFLIANGVTVQEEAKLYWKPVKPGKWNLTCSACDSHLGCREGAKFCPECGAKFVYPKALAPLPPKGE